MRAATEQRFVSTDGTELFYRRWPAVETGGPRRAIVLFHRGHEHSGRLQEVVDGLEMPGADMFAWDARGHGRSPGVRGWAESFGTLVQDADAFVRHVGEAYGFAPEEIAVVAQSVGAVLAAAWLHDFAPRVRCAVLAAPALRVKLYVPLAIPSLRLLLHVKDPAFVQSYVKPKLLTHDPERRDGQPWIMRRRTQREMDQLVEAAGFRKLEQRIDRWGIFSVGLAERVGG